MLSMKRRDFLRTAGVGALVLGMHSLVPRSGWAVGGAAPPVTEPQPYGDWRDVYLEKWSWDRVVHCSHTRANCISACAWNVFVKDGIAWREEQAQAYDEGGRDGAPDFFPRGCQKGACYSDLMTGPTRIAYPLVRVGERGEGKWKRVTWDEALDRVADAIIDAAVRDGAETVVYDQGTTNIDFGPGAAAEFRLVHVIGAANVEGWAGVGDMPMGCVQTWGMFNCEGTSDDWFHSDYIIVWSGNAVYTRIPEMHFITEARYRGARLVVIAPDYNATAIHADRWINPRVETDPALALAMAQVLIEEGRIDADYVREQTDLPFLVRTDSGKFLRQSDLEQAGRDDVFYLWDGKAGRLAVAPGTRGRKKPSLALGNLRPALEGRYRVRLADGSEIEVEPVFEVLRRDLDANYRPEQAANVTGVGAGLVRRIAREMAGAGAAMIIASWGACKHYHSDLMHRSMALLMALTGNQGKSGGGLRVAAWWSITGFEHFAQMVKVPWWQNVLLKFMGRVPVRDMEDVITRYSRERPFTPLIPWLHVHAGYAETMGNPAYNDPGNPLAHDEALSTAIEKGWLPIYPKPGKDPKVLFFSAPNPLRRWPSPQRALETLWPKLDLIVNINFQMSTTGAYSDVILPAAADYEKKGIKYSQSYLPYIVLADQAVEPMGESKDEWWIAGNLAKRIQQRARDRGIDPVEDAFGGRIDLKRAFDRWSENGKYDPDDIGGGMNHIFETSEIFEGTSWDEGVKRGVVPVKQNGMYNPVCSICGDVDPKKTLYPHAWQVEQKESWPTLTGRQQFMLDHDWYRNVGEALPTHKDAPAAGGDYPLSLTGGHTRWSIHAIWRSAELMLRLQRGEPVVFMNDRDARARGIRDGDNVRVFNDNGSFKCPVKPTAAVQPGQAVMYHAWEPLQFAGHRGQQEPVASPWKPHHLLGDYGHLHYRLWYGAPSHTPRGTRVEVERA